MSVESIEKVEPLRLANKGQAARWFDVSPQALDGWIRRGCPAVVRGSAGVPWRFDLRALAEWRYGRNATGTATEGDIDPDALDPKARLDWYRGTRERTRHQQEIGELIEAETFRTELSAVLKIVAATLEDLPDRLEREAGLPGAAVEVAIRVVDDLRERMFKRIVEVADQMSEPNPTE
jgi:phage terminase Nu1 subunit (DNA packaging protein)